MTATQKITGNYQDIFTRVWKGLEAQGFEPGYEEGGCKYRTFDGKRGCAVGVLLTQEAVDEINANGWQGSGVDRLVAHEVLAISERNLRLLKELQEAHDNGALRPYDREDRPTSVRENLREVAQRHRLKVPA